MTSVRRIHGMAALSLALVACRTGPSPPPAVPVESRPLAIPISPHAPHARDDEEDAFAYAERTPASQKPAEATFDDSELLDGASPTPPPPRPRPPVPPPLPPYVPPANGTPTCIVRFNAI